jgi:hypothetical protein
MQDSAPIHGQPPAMREPARPQADPWSVVTFVMHDLAAHGIKNRYGPETSLQGAVMAATALLESLGVAAVVEDDES